MAKAEDARKMEALSLQGWDDELNERDEG